MVEEGDGIPDKRDGEWCEEIGVGLRRCEWWNKRRKRGNGRDNMALIPSDLAIQLDSSPFLAFIICRSADPPLFIVVLSYFNLNKHLFSSLV